MKATKSMNFIYFRPVLSINDKRVNLGPYFEKIMSDSENNKFGLEKGLANIRLKSITHHKEYPLPSGASIKAPIDKMIKDTHHFVITENNRNITSIAISNAIAMKYNERRELFLHK